MLNEFLRYFLASITANDVYSIVPGGWLDGNWRQVGYQLAWVCAVWGW